MGVTLEPCEGDVFVARAGSEHQHYGDPYELACTVEIHGNLAVAKGLSAGSSPTRDTVRELLRLLREHGIHTLRIERLRDGQVVERDWKI